MQQIQKLSPNFDNLPEGTHTLPVPTAPSGEFLVNFPLQGQKKLGELIMHREGELVTISAGGGQTEFQFAVAERNKDGTIAGANEVFEAPVSNVTFRRSPNGNGWEVDASQNGIANPQAFKQASDVMLYHATKPAKPRV